jgi:hypothetical protein
LRISASRPLCCSYFYRYRTPSTEKETYAHFICSKALSQVTGLSDGIVNLIHFFDNEHAVPPAGDGRNLEVSPAALVDVAGNDAGQVSGAKANHGQCFLAFAGVKTIS